MAETLDDVDSDKVMLSPQAVGQIPFNITKEKLQTLDGVTPISASTDEPSACEYVGINEWPGIYLMIYEGRVVRADVSTDMAEKVSLYAADSLLPSIHYLRTLKPSINQLRERFPELTIQPHAYFGLGVYLIYSDPESEFALVIEYAEGKVLGLRAGMLPNVLWVEGCS
ncbi:MAG: hypothetical protein CL693_16880 [Cellvibrionaceae bacterium]|nr:hypothetical protein [Cellvibrionaceae bacterium]